MSEMPTTRESLLLKIQDDTNQQAWAEFTEIYQPVLYRFAQGRGFQDANESSEPIMKTQGSGIMGGIIPVAFDLNVTLPGIHSGFDDFERDPVVNGFVLFGHPNSTHPAFPIGCSRL
ncbi:MAG: hypothetical protein COA78_29600 [Blastopirellula sp.]|nr:MAG: hypothetical protein COA78_29600 [Blastopirellula sp.]